MKYTIISDIHLGNKLFKKPKKFFNFLEYISNNTDILILNGDILDLWENYEAQIVLDYFDIFSQLIQISKLKKIYYIIGNHDYRMINYISNFRKFKTNINFLYPELKLFNEKVFISHGHRQFDIPFGRTFLDITESALFTWTFRRIVHLKFLVHTYDKILKYFTNKNGKNMRNHKFFKETDILSKEKKYKLFCYGHTHDPGIERRHKYIMANSGDWLQHYSFLEIENNIVGLFQWIVDSPSLIKSEKWVSDNQFKKLNRKWH